jgi:V/A-type H+-transporting ATPase subunit A
MDNPCYIYGINGPVLEARGGSPAMREVVRVGRERLIGEVVRIDGERITIQVYEDTDGLRRGDPVECTGVPMSITLGPGLLDNILDGIGRPLRAIEEASGPFISRGLVLDAVDKAKVWAVTVTVKEGDTLAPGQPYGYIQETPVIRHYLTVPPGQGGIASYVAPDGDYRADDCIAEAVDAKGKSVKLTLCQAWPIRRQRPVAQRLPLSIPLITGQRIIDTLFPIAKGGSAAIPGPFGAGKTVTQHQLAKWSDADIIVYLGCGERGNEMTEVLEEFSGLIDPKSGFPLMARTVLIANTSNMPVAAREASVYTGMTIAEYFRDMGYHVAMMADSTSRWAEALREISGRLEEMPAEEGFPAYLPSRLAEFYERAGYMRTLGGSEGSVTVVGAVSPQGGDFSEPVTQNTKRFVRCFWALDRALAYARHFPSINWINSYSEYQNELAAWYEEHMGREFRRLRSWVSALLQEESQLMEIVKLIGSDILPEDQKLVIETARVVRLGFLQQNSFNEIDTYVPMEKQGRMLELIMKLHDRAKAVVEKSIPLSQLKATGIFEALIRLKYEVPNDKLDLMDRYGQDIDEAVDKVLKENL